ncbi:VOC family protein [Pseudaestuariivita atlantica]|uniref:Extradiol dioxygenase n=1 Tax=Pseudaestuariivita atlantica TaxID=1317121 RepID=A0A0L1JUL2_9RHOB|nr:VOC family protein [Pseudaestuariivita atlantica]KNG95430.1 extradiol dioxygenase [Pseudaestuariivita atlantica]
MSQHLHAIAILVPDYDAGIAFYVGKAGFDLLEDTDMGGGKRWVLVRPPGGETALLLARAVGEQARGIGDQFAGRVGLFLHTDDFAGDHARMRAAGITFEEEPRHEPYGTVAVWRDPWGTRWDLLQLARP